MKKLFTYSSLILLFLGFTLTSFGQVTTSGLTGEVKDGSGEILIGATVRATHMPSGSVYGVITQDNGRFVIPNMRVGGPYTVEASYIGHRTQTFENNYLTLGEKLALDFALEEEGITAAEVLITATLDPIMNAERTGPSTAVSREQLDNLPTISRSAEDYTRLNTMAAEGGSFAGRNDQFNNYSLDGAIFNNPFGLDAATPGGQSNAQAVSLDAIEQIKVSIAPYDVTQSGFTGASINSVSKSGTNEFKGTVFGFFRNSSMTGGKVDGVDIFKGDPKQTQFGFSIGGPIVKNKVFFFANFEKEDRSDLGSLWVPSGGSQVDGNVSRVPAADMQRVSQLLSTLGYDTGLASGYVHEEDNYKGLFKLDFNLSDNHKLSATYNFLDAFNDLTAHPSAIGRRGPDFQTLQFENSGYRINNKIQQFRAELKSFFANKFSNKLTVGYTHFDDFRDPKSEPFPIININQDGIRAIVAGHEPFSINNRLDQKVLQIKDELSIFSNNHTWTIGAAFERFNFDNSFNLGTLDPFPFDFEISTFGGGFSSVDALEDAISSGRLGAAVDAARATAKANTDNNTWALAETNLGQFSFYAQDEIQVNDKLNVSVGLRIDMPLYFNTPELAQESIDRNCCYDPSIVWSDEEGNNVQFNSTEFPSSTPLFNPRIGFNYDMKGDRSAQLRGGTGLFSGRFPFVWVGNQVANPNSFFYTVTDPNFKYPQIWRTSLGYDRQYGKGWIGTIDLLYTKDLQAQVVNNYGLRLPGSRLIGADTRPIYRAEDRVGGGSNAYVFTNVSGGYSFNASFSVERNWNDTYMKLGYNYLKATDVMSVDAEISSDAYDRNPGNINHTNLPETSPSLYGNQHRIVGVASKKFAWGGSGMATTVSIFFEYVAGNRFSYTYVGDINNDGSPLNDLLYIPTESEIAGMNFSSAGQNAAFNAFIEQDEYLSSRRGDYAEKYGTTSPWYSTWDMRVLQDIGVGSNKFQLSIDVLNFANLINSGWGVRQLATGTSLAQPIAVSVADGDPTYTFDSSLTSTFQNDFNIRSRWRLQLGLRYIF